MDVHYVEPSKIYGVNKIRPWPYSLKGVFPSEQFFPSYKVRVWRRRTKRFFNQGGSLVSLRDNEELSSKSLRQEMGRFHYRYVLHLMEFSCKKSLGKNLLSRNLLLRFRRIKNAFPFLSEYSNE